VPDPLRDGWYASRTRGIRRQAGTEGQQTVYAASVAVPLREAPLGIAAFDWEERTVWHQYRSRSHRTCSVRVSDLSGIRQA